MPAASFAAVVIVAVYCVPALRVAEGVKLAVLPITLTLPPTTAPPALGAKVKLAVERLEFVIASENVAEIEEFSATPLAEFTGAVAETNGGVVSEVPPVVKFQV